MSPSQVNHVFTALPNERTLHIPIKISVNNQIIETTTIINCGTIRNFIDPGLVVMAEFPLQKLDRQVKAYNIDGTTNLKGNIVWETHVDLLFPKHQENIKLMVLNLGRKQIILGMPWLKKWNPAINWIAKRISIRSVGRGDAAPLREFLPSWTNSLAPQRYILHWLGMDADLKTTCRLKKREAWLVGETVRKVTISTQITQETKLTEAVLLEWCKDFKDMFSEKTHDKLPPHQPYDHIIDLKPNFVLKIVKVYPLNPLEMETCKVFVEEHLKTGRIVPSKSPCSSSSPRKMAPYVPVKTTDILIPSLSRTPILYPSSRSSLMT